MTNPLISDRDVAFVLYELLDVVSRKKQLLPYLTHCLRERERGVKG